MVDGKIIQGTTPQFNFDLPLDKSNIADIRFSFEQKGKVVLIKENGDYVINEDLDDGRQVVSFELTQEDTYKFKHRDGNVVLRMRLMINGGQVLISNKIFLLVEDLADKVVMGQ